MARWLNTLLADLTVRPTAAMTTQDQLDQLFRAEIERMAAHLDDIAFAVRRGGVVDDVREMEADIEVGWAYRLIQLFGTTRALSFEADCPGRSMLLRHGIPEPHVATIAETFRAEQAEARSAVFDRADREQMADVGLADTLADRERAKMELYRAKADALLNVAERWPMIDRKQNALVATTLPEEERASLVFPADNADEAGSDDTSAETNQRDQPEPPLSVAGDAEKSGLPVEPSSDDELAEAVPPKGHPIETRTAERPEPKAGPAGRILHLDAFEASYEALARNNRGNWPPAAASDVRMLVRMLRDILEENDVAHSGETGQQDVGALRQHLNLIPTRIGQSSRQALPSQCRKQCGLFQPYRPFIAVHSTCGTASKADLAARVDMVERSYIEQLDRPHEREFA
jgi:hypothetical protein